MKGQPTEKLLKRKCRYCGKTFKVPRYPKRKGCPECAPTLDTR